MRAGLLVSAFLLSATVAASQPACLIFVDCIYVPVRGYRACGVLQPVLSTTDAGAIEIVDELGLPPDGCTCIHPDTAAILDANPLDPQLDPIFDQIQAAARVDCEELALELGADPTPCATAVINKASVDKGQATDKCLFADGDIDDDPDCPPSGEDEVGFTTTDEGTDTGETDDGGVVQIPDLPKQP